MQYFMLRPSQEGPLNEKQVCVADCTDIEHFQMNWLSGKPFPSEYAGPVQYDLPNMVEFMDYIVAVNAPFLVSNRFSELIAKLSSVVRAYHACVLHKGKVLRNDLYSLNFEHAYNAVDSAKSELEMLDLGGGVKVPYRYRYVFLNRNNLPEDNIFRIPFCGKMIASEKFRTVVENEGIVGCEFFDFEGELL